MKTTATLQPDLERDVGDRPQPVRRIPVALMIPVDAESLDETLETLRRARGLEALRAIRRESAARGLTRLSMREIDALVRETRNARRPSGRG